MIPTSGATSNQSHSAMTSIARLLLFRRQAPSQETRVSVLMLPRLLAEAVATPIVQVTAII